MAYKVANNAAAALAVNMNTSVTTLQVTTGNGDLFPAISGPDHTRITLENASGDIEVMKVTARALGSDSMTVVRAQDGTTAKTWLIGDIVEARPTAGVIEDIQAEIDSDIIAHKAESDPHPTYLTQAEADALYEDLAGAATKPGVQGQTYTSFTASGTDTYAATPSPALGAYAANQRFRIKFTNSNTGAATLNLNSLGAKTLKKQTRDGNAVLAAGDIPAGALFDVEYDGTDMVLLSPLPATINQGRQVLGNWPAGSIKPRTSNGCALLAWDESMANKVMTGYLAFDKDFPEYAQFSFKAPKGLDESAGFTAVIEWKEASGATVHGCAWGIKMQAQGDGDTIDSVWGMEVRVNDAGSAGTRRQAAESAAITPGGSWAAGDAIIVEVRRVADDGTNDTLNVDAHLIEVTLFAVYNSATEPA